MTERAFIMQTLLRYPLTPEAIRETLKEALGDQALCERAIALGVLREVHPARLLRWRGTEHFRDFGLRDTDFLPATPTQPKKTS